MERMTHKDGKGWFIEDQSVAYDERRRGKVVDRLAAYEDAGLTPEEIERVLDAYGRGMTLRSELRERLDASAGITTDRLRELAKAELDGRLVVLPQDDGKNTAMYGICEDNGEVCNIHVDSVGDPKQLPSLLSYLTAALARELGATYHSLLMAMLRYPSVVDMPGNKELAKEAADGTAQV